MADLSRSFRKRLEGTDLVAGAPVRMDPTLDWPFFGPPGAIFSICLAPGGDFFKIFGSRGRFFHDFWPPGATNLTKQKGQYYKKGVKILTGAPALKLTQHAPTAVLWNPPDIPRWRRGDIHLVL